MLEECQRSASRSFMSASGSLADIGERTGMSALPLKADMLSVSIDVR